MTQESATLMTDTVIDSTKELTKAITESDGLNTFFDKLVAATDIVTNKIIDVAPDAANLVLDLVRFKGIYSIAVSLTLLLMAFLVYKTQRFLFKKHISMMDKTNRDAEDFSFYAFATILLCILQIFLIIPSLIKIFCFYNILSIVSPEGAVTLRALEAAGITL